MNLGSVARMHYELGLTHQEIADALGISRVRVTRMLAQARAAGIVRITVESDEPVFAMFQTELADQFGLRRTWVAPSTDNDVKARDLVAAAGAAALMSLVNEAPVIALGLSSAVAEAIAAFPPGTNRDDGDGHVVTGNTLVTASGSLAGPLQGWNPHELASRLAIKVGGEAFHTAAPMTTESAEAALVNLSEPAVKKVLDMAANADAIVMGLGGIAPDSGLLLRSLSESQYQDLVRAGAVGDVIGHYFDRDGHPIEHEFIRRVIGITFDQLLRIPRRVVIVRGEKKLPALRAALAGGLVTDLVTDHATAVELLREAGSRRDDA